MKIIQMGTHPLDELDKPYQLTCSKCKTVIEVNETDMSPNIIYPSYFSSSVTSYYCDCPVCKEKIHDSNSNRMNLRNHVDYIPRFVLFSKKTS